MRRAPHGPRSDPARSAWSRRLVLRGGWAAEEGIALILSVLVMGVLTIATAATITAVTSNEHSFGRDRHTNRALNIAEGGLNAGVAAVKALPATATTLSSASGTLDQGSWSYTGSRTQDATNPSLYYWTVTSTGTSPDGKVTRIVSTKVSETITQTSSTTTIAVPASPVYGWGLFLGDATSDCTPGGSGGNTLGGSSGVTVDVYIKGSLCVSGNSSPFILQPTGTTDTVTVYVGNKFKSKSNASPIGTSSAKIHLATVVGGCIDANHGSSPNYTSVVCSKQGSPLNNTASPSYGSGVYATSYSSTQNDLSKPTIDTAWYTNAKPGPTTGCSLTSTYPLGWTATQFKNAVFDNDSTRNTSLGTVRPLALVNQASGAPATLANSFDCKSYDADGNLVGQLKWDYPAGCGNAPANGVADLTISGTVFIDGNLSFAACDYAVYQGRGTIYVNGTVTFANGAKVCAKVISGTPCNGNFDANANLLEIVAVNASNVSPGFSLSGAGTYEGISFVNGKFNAGNGSNVNGPVIADTATMSGNAKLRSSFSPPSGAPGAATTTTTTTSGPDQASWSSVPGSWQQLK